MSACAVVNQYGFLNGQCSCQILELASLWATFCTDVLNCVFVCFHKCNTVATNEKQKLCSVCRFLSLLSLVIWDVFGFGLFTGATTTSETKTPHCLFKSMALTRQPCLLVSRCCECRTSLSHWYYEKDGRLFCKKDYWVKFGELCHGCNDPITTGLIMVTTSSTLRVARLVFGGRRVYCGAINVVSRYPTVDVFTPWPPALHHRVKLSVRLALRLY